MPAARGASDPPAGRDAPGAGQLAGKVALVTGSSRGIGRAIALLFAAEGADVAVNCIKEVEKAEQVADEIRSRGRRGLVVRADVADRDQVDGMVQRVAKEFRRIDVLVNNAGVYEKKPVSEMTDAFFDRMVAVNMRSVVLTTRAALPFLSRGSRGIGTGAVINISSVYGTHGAAESSAYCAAKAGMISLTQSLAEELAPGLRVNCIAPGYVDTDMNPWAPRPSGEKAGILDEILLRRVGKPEDIAQVALFLASEASRFITGQTIVADGGTRY